MKYLLLIYENEADFANISEAEGNKIFQEYMDYTRGIKKNGNYIGGEALQPVATATTVRQRNGKTLTTDGPFAETKEQLGGRSAAARSRCGRSCRPRRSSRTGASRRRPADESAGRLRSLSAGKTLDVSISGKPRSS
jgi:hypothetical protein